MTQKMFLCIIMLACLFTITGLANADTQVNKVTDNFAAVNAYGAKQVTGSPILTGTHEYMIYGRQQIIRQDGLIKYATMSIDDADVISEFTISVWYVDDEGKWHRRAQSEDISSLLVNGNNTIEFSEPLEARTGDHYGFKIVTSAPALSLYTPIDKPLMMVYDDGNAPDNLNWVSERNGIYPREMYTIKLYENSPDCVFIGDSLVDGWTNLSIGPYVATPEAMLTKGSLSFPYYFAIYSGMTVQNMGIGGDNSARILARFNQDVILLHPKYAIFNAGINNFVVKTNENALNDMTHMCIENNIIPVYFVYLPREDLNGSDINTVNDYIYALAANTTGAMVLDARASVSNKTVSNKWNRSYGTDGVHPLDTGKRVIARTLYDEFKSHGALNGDVMFIGDVNNVYKMVAPSKSLRMNCGFQSDKISSATVDIDSVTDSDPYSKIPRDGLRLWLPFDNNTTDMSGRSNAVYANNVTYVPGKYNYAANFTYGKSAIVSCNSSIMDSSDNGQSVFLSFKPMYINKPGIDISRQYLFTTFSPILGARGICIDLFHVPDVNYIEVIYTNSTGYQVACDYPIYDLNKTYNVLVTYDNSMKMIHMYVNGIVRSFVVPSSPKFDYQTHIGTFDLNDREYRGWIDEVIVWNRTLNSTEANIMVSDRVDNISMKFNNTETYSNYTLGGKNQLIMNVASSGLISDIDFKVSNTSIQNGTQIYNYSDTALMNLIVSCNGHTQILSGVGSVSGNYIDPQYIYTITHTHMYNIIKGNIVYTNTSSNALRCEVLFSGTATTNDKKGSSYIVPIGNIPIGSNYYSIVLHIPPQVTTLTWLTVSGLMSLILIGFVMSITKGKIRGFRKKRQ